jgi:hypothetical protein
MYKDKYIKYKAKYIDIMSEINSKNLNQTGGFNDIEISSIEHEGGWKGPIQLARETAAKAAKAAVEAAKQATKKTPFIDGPDQNFNIFDEHREYSAKIVTGERANKISKLHGYFTKYQGGSYSRVVQFAVNVRFADYETSAKELLFISNLDYDLLGQDGITLTGKLYENSEPQEGDFILNITEESLSYSVDGEVKYEISEPKLQSSEILVASSASYITSIPITEISKEAKKINLQLNGNSKKKYTFSQIGLDALSAADTELHLYSDMIVITKGLMGMLREGEVAVDNDVSINSEEFQNY